MIGWKGEWGDFGASSFVGLFGVVDGERLGEYVAQALGEDLAGGFVFLI